MEKQKKIGTENITIIQRIKVIEEEYKDYSEEESDFEELGNDEAMQRFNDSSNDIKGITDIKRM